MTVALILVRTEVSPTVVWKTNRKCSWVINSISSLIHYSAKHWCLASPEMFQESTPSVIIPTLLLTMFFAFFFFSLQVDLSSESPYIQDTHCTCKAVLGHCNHLLGLLYTLAHYLKMGHKSVPPSTSKTSLPQTWHVPSRTLGLKPKSISRVSVSKVKPPNVNPQRVNRTSAGILPNVYCPVPLPLPCGEFEDTHLNTFINNTQSFLNGCLFLLLFILTYIQTFRPTTCTGFSFT